MLKNIFHFNLFIFFINIMQRNLKLFNFKFNFHFINALIIKFLNHKHFYKLGYYSMKKQIGKHVYIYYLFNLIHFRVPIVILHLFKQLLQVL